MKRRNADCGKVRRPLKRTKIPENIYGSTFLYIKFLLVWSVVLLADFILEFRFEYLWPFWLLLRSVYDSFKYQGLAFSVFFVCIALTSDMICFLFIPVHWLFFAASTYVWVQYVWHTERGICLPTISLWLLFVYIEASVRLKELKSLPFHLDLCRPFAAHCIGYPVVTLGFGFKSYIGYKMRQRKQKEVAKENHFYIQLLQQALPPEQQSITSSPEKNSSSKSVDEVLLDGVGHNNNNNNNNNNNSNTSTNNNSSANSASSSNKKLYPSSSSGGGNRKNCENAVNNSGGSCSSKFSEVVGDVVRDGKRHSHSMSNGHAGPLDKELEYMEATTATSPTTTTTTHNNNSSSSNHTKVRSVNNSVNDFDEREDFDHDKSFKANGVIHKMNSGAGGGGGSGTSGANVRSWGSSSPTTTSAATVASSSLNHLKDNGGFGGGGGSGQTTTTTTTPGGGKRKNGGVKDSVANNLNSQKDEHVLRLEGDIKRLKADLQASRQCEQELRGQVNSLLVGERAAKSELTQFQQDNESLQSKLHGLVTARQQDKQTICSLEKKLQEERRCRSVIESQLATERKNRKAEEAAARAVALATANARSDCTDSCKTHRKEMETEMKLLRRDLKMTEDRLRQSEREGQVLRQYKDTHSETEVLMSALSAMQDKNTHLENSLSAETRLKLDLFSALGEAKRQLEITQSMVLQKDKEIDDLKTKIAEVMAVMPPSSYAAVSMEATMMNGSALYSSKFVPEDKISNSNLDPNALVYTPKGVLTPVSVVSSVDI